MSCTPSLFGVLDNWWVVTHRRHIFAFHWYQWVGNKTFSHRLCTGYQKKNSCLWLWLCPCYKVPEFSRHPSLLLRHSWVCQQDCGDPLYMTGVMMYFRYYGKTKSLLFGLELPMHQSRSNWTNACILCSIRSVPSFIQISQQRWPKKPLFNS